MLKSLLSLGLLSYKWVEFLVSSLALPVIITPGTYVLALFWLKGIDVSINIRHRYKPCCNSGFSAAQPCTFEILCGILFIYIFRTSKMSLNAIRCYNRSS